MSKILFCRVAYMNNYDLDIVSDVPQNGGAYVRKTGDAGEKINFHNFNDGLIYGFVETRGDLKNKPYQIHIERIEAQAGESLDGVHIVFCAKDPSDNKTKVVGWYRYATIFRHQQHLVHNGCSYPYFFKDEFKNSVLIPSEERNIFVPTTQADGYGMGQTNVWYADKDDERIRVFVHNVLVAMGEA